MAEILYMNDSYLKEFTAKVLKSENGKLFLDRTAFYPVGGGLPCDRGLIIWNSREFPVKDIRKEDGDVAHYIEGEIPASEEIIGKIDWDFRYRIMRMHTSAHILSALINKKTGGLITGNQIGYEKSRIDFNLENFDKSFMASLVDEANQLIAKGAPVHVKYMDREEALKLPGMVKLAGKLPPAVKTLRIVEIEGIDTQADGGPHVADAKEIGKIVMLKAENKGKNNRRLYFTLEP